MRRKIVLLPLLFGGLLSGCASTPRWQIQSCQYDWGEQSEHTDHGTILLDSRTGKTWMFMSNEEEYYWKPIPLRKAESGKGSP